MAAVCGVTSAWPESCSIISVALGKGGYSADGCGIRSSSGVGTNGEASRVLRVGVSGSAVCAGAIVLGGADVTGGFDAGARGADR